MILDNYNAVIPEKAKELVMMLGKRSDEGEFPVLHEILLYLSEKWSPNVDPFSKRRCICLHA